MSECEFIVYKIYEKKENLNVLCKFFRFCVNFHTLRLINYYTVFYA